MATVTVVDETPGAGGAGEAFTLEFLDERVTARELIRARVYQEVTEFNAARAPYFRGLVQPRDSQRTRYGFALRARRPLDWREQYERALDAFAGNGFILLVDERQVESLDEEIDLRHDSSVTFLRLMPLVGG
jgi:hypothetical protein